MSVSLNSNIRFFVGLLVLLCTSVAVAHDIAYLPEHSSAALGYEQRTLQDGDGNTMKSRDLQWFPTHDGLLDLDITELPAEFSVGDQLTLNAAVEVEEGIIFEEDAMLLWQVRFHTTPTSYTLLLNTTAGNNIECPPIPDPPHLQALMYGFVRVLLTTADDPAFENAIVADLYPKVVNIELKTSPNGVYLHVMGNTMVFGPTILPAWNNQMMKISASDPRPYVFARWADPAGGSARERTIHVTEDNPKEFTAIFYQATGDPTPSPSIMESSPPSDVPSDMPSDMPSSLPTLQSVLSFAVTHFSLIEANTNATLVETIPDGATFRISVMGTALSVRAHTTGPVGSLQFDFAGIIGYKVENNDPFSLGGNSPKGSGGPYYGSVPELATPGTYTVAATPFSGEKLRGQVGETVEVSFTVAL